MLTPNSRLRPNEAEVAAKVMDGEAIMINLSNGMYYSMDGVGGLVWDLIAERRSLDEIAAAIGRRYDVAPTRARADLDRLAGELLDEKLVFISEDEGPAGHQQASEQASKRSYEPPQLNKYSDMGDLLALDPPMPGLSDIPWQGPAEPAAR